MTLLGKELNEEFEFSIDNKSFEYEVIDIQMHRFY